MDQLEGFLAEFAPHVARRGRAILEKMRARLPRAIELVYDNYRGLVVGFGPTERPSEAIFSIAIYPAKIALCFLRGAALPDPAHLLKGSGNVVRHIVLAGPETLDEPAVEALIAAALAASPKPIAASEPGRTIVRSVSAKRLPRRPNRT